MSLNFKYRIDFRIGVKNLLTLAGLSTLFGVVRHSVTNLLTLAGLWTLSDISKTVNKHAKQVSINLPRLAGL